MIGVLLVDDDPLTIEVHRRHLERIDGFEVVGECRDARSAVGAILEAAPGAIDLVLLDVTMPDGTGVDVLRHIRARGDAVDVIAVTGVRDADVVRQMVALGVTQYLVKPFTFATFSDRLRQYVDFRRRASDAAGPATQEEIDALLGALRPPTATALPKGLSAESLDRIAQAVRVGGPLSAVEAAEQTGLSRVSARRYLEHLVDAGRVDRIPRYHGRGRPESEYRWRS